MKSIGLLSGIGRLPVDASDTAHPEVARRYAAKVADRSRDDYGYDEE